MNTNQRHLAAILFTDIVGYTAMMQENESKAVAAIKRHNQALERLAGIHHGRVVNYYGDGSLCIFQSATEAVQCALEVQEELRKVPVVPLRIGLHIGEISFEEEKALGDGVNIASRIQSLGQANTILLSKEIMDKIRNQPEFKTVSLGNFDFKNVNEPVEVFALANEGLTIPKKNTLEGKLKTPLAKNKSRRIAVFVGSLLLLSVVVFFLVRKLNAKAHGRAIEKSIAVLPFANMSNDKDQEYFSEGITDDILDHLVKISDLKVKSRTSTLRYRGSIKTTAEIGDELGVGAILEGSVRKSGNTVRIVVQLIDTKTDEHLFSQTYDREIKDVLTTQSEIAIEIANALQAKLSPAEKENINRKASVDISAYDYYLKARDILFRSADEQKGNEKAVLFLRSAIALDSNYAAAYALMSIFYNNKKWFGSPSSVWTDSALLLAEKAIQIDPRLPDGYVSRVNILIGTSHFQAAEADLNKAYSLAPNNGLVLELMAQSLGAKGEFKRSAATEIRAMDILFSNKDPEYSEFWGYLYYISKDYIRSEKMYSLAFSLDPGNYRPLLALGRLYFEQKKYKEAASSYEKVLSLEPKVSVAIDGLAWCFYFLGDMDRAIANWSKYKEIESFYSDSTQFIPFRHRLAYIKWELGDKAEAKKLFDEQLRLDREAITHKTKIGVWENGSEAYDYAVVNAFLGNKALAYQWLDTALAKNFYVKWLLEKDPLLAGIRSENRFQDYVARVNKKDNEYARVKGVQEAIREYEIGKRNSLNNSRLN